jgi:hypothetical protein
MKSFSARIIIFSNIELLQILEVCLHKLVGYASRDADGPCDPTSINPKGASLV